MSNPRCGCGGIMFRDIDNSLVCLQCGCVTYDDNFKLDEITTNSIMDYERVKIEKKGYQPDYSIKKRKRRVK